MGGLEGPPKPPIGGSEAARGTRAAPRGLDSFTRSVRVEVIPTADAVDPEALGGAAVLIVDVLRASTTIITALAHGAAAVVPVAGPSDARLRAGAFDDGGAIVAGERGGEMVPGFDLGNSPVAFASERVRGRTVVFTTSNGTRALLAARRAAAVGIAALVNASAASAWAEAQARDVVIVCAGERGRSSLEDTVCAGLLVERLPGTTPTAAAREAVTTARRYGADVGRLAVDSRWARHLDAAGHGLDVAACLALDTTAVVPVYLPDVDKVVLAPR
ncbi:MAG: 2-phosphosulfolactate phosphatase [Candidatus Rokubacteria bacterium]|nr:2-phosphosulfolactate phosphatase [Candidatus Rokubacteria bacterium]